MGRTALMVAGVLALGGIGCGTRTSYLRSADTVAMRVAIGLVVDFQQRECCAGVAEFAATLLGALFDQDSSTLHAFTPYAVPACLIP